MRSPLPPASLVLAAVALVACHAAPLQGVGLPTDLPASSRAAATVAPAPTSPIPADFADHLARVGPDAFVSWGHAGGRFVATVYVTPEARATVLGAGADLAPGTLIVMADVDRRTHGPGPTFFMHKEAPLAGAPSEWRFGVVEDPAAHADDLALCVRCHDEAPHDHVFRLPE
jgi:hypothetical protein